jgi:hypothetical protein
MTVAIRHDIVSVSEFDVICEVRETDSPRVGFDIPRGQVPVKLANPLASFNSRN